MPLSNHSIVVHKFGGAALANAAAIANVGTILLAEPDTSLRVVVTSALEGVTNQLLSVIAATRAGNDEAARAIINALRARHLDVGNEVLVGDEQSVARAALNRSINSSCDALGRQVADVTVDDPDGALSDAILAHGERMAARIVCEMLVARGTPSVVVDGALLIQTDGRHGNAAPDLARTDAMAPRVLEAE